MSRLLLHGGRVLDPGSDRDEVLDVLIEDGRIAEIGPALQAADSERIDATGSWVTPGFVDLHTHLREPGQEYKEDIASGGRAAAAGGFTTIACMANTLPVNDDPSVTDFILDRARQDAPVQVLPIAAATKGLAGETMTEMDALVRSGAVAFSDDGKTVMNGGTMRRVLEYSKLVSKPIIVHAEDRTLVGDGVINEGAVSTRLGLPGNPSVAEVSLVARDLMLAEITGAHLHVAHVSTAGAIELIRDARARGVHITSEVTPHHLMLTDEASLGYDTNTKVAPPLRGEADRDALRVALAEGIIDAIATDHAPHAEHEKESDFRSAPPGMIGLETAFSVVSELVRSGALSPLDLVRRLSTEPARVLGIAGGKLAEGEPADIVVIDPDASWTYDPAKGFSKSRNSPWAGETLRGRVRKTIVAGRCVYDSERGVLYP